MAGQDPSLDTAKQWLPGWAYVAVVVVLAVTGLGRQLGVFAGVTRLVSWFGQSSRREERKRTSRYRSFARHLAGQIDRLNQKAEWRDERFTELEAEVEAEGQLRVRALLTQPFRRSARLRREPSLARALTRSRERLVLVVGEPGAGKSVALRHVALRFARRASRQRAARASFPIYIDLKGFSPDPSLPLTSDDVRAYVQESLRKVNDRDVDRFISDEFDPLLGQGRLVFLFDSFDEIPEILSADDADPVIRRYSDALYDFLNGVHRCRGVIASRTFRAPREPSWVRFKITPLSPTRTRKLIGRADLDVGDEGVLLSRLEDAPHTIQRLAENPMFLGLLCDYVRLNHDFPAHSHMVFEDYVHRRLERDASRLQARFHLAPAQLREAAENLAFKMGSSLTTGLTPTRRELHDLYLDEGGGSDLGRVLDALEYVKLGRDDQSVTEERTFSFAHRRFQEYFATCLVLRRPELIDNHRLLTDGRWRETAVAVLQLQPRGAIEPLLYEAGAQLSGHVEQLRSRTDAGEPFFWPPNALQLLSILDTGLTSRADVDVATLQNSADVLLEASTHGHIWERKFGLEVAGAGSQEQLHTMLRSAFAGQSDWLRSVAYRQVSRLNDLTTDMVATILRTLMTLSAEGRLRRDRTSIDAQIRRMPDHGRILDSKRLLLAIPIIDAALITTVTLLLLGRLQSWLTAPVTPEFDDRPWAQTLISLTNGRWIEVASVTQTDGHRVFFEYPDWIETPDPTPHTGLFLLIAVLAGLALYVGRSSSRFVWASGGSARVKQLRESGLPMVGSVPGTVFLLTRASLVVSAFLLLPVGAERSTTSIVIPFRPMTLVTHFRSPGPGFLAVFLLFAVTWSWAALFAARGSAPARPWIWPVLPFVVMIRNWKDVSGRILLVGVPLTGIVFIGLVADWLDDNVDIHSRPLSLALNGLLIAWLVAAGTVLLWTVAAGAGELYAGVKSLRYARRAERDPHLDVQDVGQVMDTLQLVTRPQHAKRVLLVASTYRPLVETAAYRDFLVALAAQLDDGETRPAAPPDSDFTRWWVRWNLREDLDIVEQAELLDAVGEAMEQALDREGDTVVDLSDAAVGPVDLQRHGVEGPG